LHIRISVEETLDLNSNSLAQLQCLLLLLLLLLLPLWILAQWKYLILSPPPFRVASLPIHPTA
jgi:hypothetical protein